jgi:glycosyltransferase involved in cell wall biosynthesis
MKVLLINKYHYIKGGSDRVYFNTNMLLEENHHEVAHFSTKSKDNSETSYSSYFVDSVEYRDSTSLQKILGVKDYIYNRKAYDNLSSLVEEFQPDIAHLHLFYGGLSGSVLKSLRRHKIPMVMTVHDYRLLCPANAFLDAQGNICEKCINRSFYQCAMKKCLDGNFLFSSILSLEAYSRKYLIDPVDYIDHFIFVSKFSRDIHRKFDSRFNDKSSHLYNFTFSPAETASPDKEGYILFFGRLSKEKGLLNLLNLFKRIKYKLKIAGFGPLENEVIEAAKSNPNIIYLGQADGQNLGEIIKGSSFVIVPSLCYENNPMTILEAYSYGIPVIGSRLGGIPEIVDDFGTGFLFEPRNESDLEKTIVTAMNLSSSEYERMSQSAREFGKRFFTPEIHYRDLIQIYNKVLQNV